MALNLLPYNIKENLVKIYTDDKLSKHLSPDGSENGYNDFWTKPSQEIKEKCVQKLKDLYEYVNPDFVTLTMQMFISDSKAQQSVNLNDYFGEWQRLVYLMYSFLDNKANNASDLLIFNLRTADSNVHHFALTKKPTPTQPGNAVFSVLNEGSQNEMADDDTTTSIKHPRLRDYCRLYNLTYNQLLNKIVIQKKAMSDLDSMQLFFLLCLEISRQLVDNAMFYDSSMAALLVLEDKLIMNDKMTFEDSFISSKKANGKFKMIFKLLHTDQERDKDIERRMYRKQYEFNLLLGCYKPNKTFAALYEEQPNVLYEHFKSKKQSKLFVKYSVLTRRGQEIKSRLKLCELGVCMKASGDTWRLHEDDDLNEINQFARMKLLYDVIKLMREENDGGFLEFKYCNVKFALELFDKDRVELFIRSSNQKLDSSCLFGKSATTKSELENAMASMFAEVNTVNSSQRRGGAPSLMAIITYLTQAINENHIDSSDAIAFTNAVLNTKKTNWNEEEFVKKVVKKVAPMVKNCEEREKQALASLHEICVNAVHNTYKDEDDREAFLEEKVNDMYESLFIKINVKDPSKGQTITLNVPKQASTSFLSSMIFNRTGIAPCMQQFMYNSKPIHGSLQDHGVGSGHTIFMLKRVGGG